MAVLPRTIPTIDVHGTAVPRLGFGTWRLSGQPCQEAVSAALRIGYRHIDTASMYENEEHVGAALAASGLARDRLFVTTKVWRDDLRRDAFLRSAEASLRRLKLETVDLLLIHWPNADIPLSETMDALNEAKRRGLTRHIGVSNFPITLLNQATKLSSEPIFANQCEYHPGLDQSALIAACRERGAAFVSYRPLGQGKDLDHSTIREIAQAHGKTPSQVVLRWHMQQPGLIAIPRSANPEHISENAAVFDFTLSDEEMRAIFALAAGGGRHVNPAFAPAWDTTPKEARS
jgi:diketogulonate reductase-like aldo/keto reductase